MIGIRNSSLIVGTILILAFLLAECNAYEVSMLTVKEANLSIDLTPDFNVSYLAIPSAEDAVIGQMIIINDTNNKSNSADLMLLSFSDKSILEANAKELSTYLENILFGAFKLGGAVEKETYYLTNRYQQNITIRAMDMPNSKNPTYRELSYMALWSHDKLNYFFIMSNERSLTNKIVESLEVKD